MSFDPTKYTKSPWLKASDLPGSGQQVTIQYAKEHHFERDQETKPVISFLEIDQKLVLNKTRIKAIIDAFGTDPLQWEGKQIHLSAGSSGMGPTVVITAAQQPTAQPTAAAAAPQPAAQPAPQPPAPDTGDVLFA